MKTKTKKNFITYLPLSFIVNYFESLLAYNEVMSKE